MRVSEVMTKSPAYISADATLELAAEIMAKHNCGFLPVLTPQQHLVGVVTDRDACIAVAKRNRLPAPIRVQEVASVMTYTCHPDDDVRAAMQTMADKRVRRLPVIDVAGKLEGVLSVDDIVLHADLHSQGALSAEYILSALRNLFGSQLHQPQEKPAAR